jgi:hypothetical protein
MNNKEIENSAKVLLAVVSPEKEPENCLKEWNEKICDNCEFVDYDMVGHPGGSSVHSVKKHYCKLGHWAEDF